MPAGAWRAIVIVTALAVAAVALQLWIDRAWL